jgi:hypothetical protein
LLRSPKKQTAPINIPIEPLKNDFNAKKNARTAPWYLPLASKRILISQPIIVNASATNAVTKINIRLLSITENISKVVINDIDHTNVTTENICIALKHTFGSFGRKFVILNKPALWVRRRRLFVVNKQIADSELGRGRLKST